MLLVGRSCCLHLLLCLEPCLSRALACRKKPWLCTLELQSSLCRQNDPCHGARVAAVPPFSPCSIKPWDLFLAGGLAILLRRI